MKALPYLTLTKLSLFCLFGLACSLLACNREVSQIEIAPQKDSDVSIKNGRLTFKDGNSYRRTLKQLEGLRTQEQIREWENRHSFTSLRQINEDHRNDSSYVALDLPIVLKAILNSNGEYAVADTIVWFNKNYNCFVPNNDEKLLSSVKLNPEAYKEKRVIGTNIISKEGSSKGARVFSTNLGTASGSDARWQYVWAVNGETGPWRKTVFEVQTYSVSSSVGYHNWAVVRVKLEWWSPSNGWQAGANDIQEPLIDISGTVMVAYGSGQAAYSLGPYSAMAQFNTPNMAFHVSYNHDTEKVFYSEDNARATSMTVDLYGKMSSSVTINGVYQYNSPYIISSSSGDYPGTNLW